MPDINAQEIIEYYEQCQVDYEIVWHLKNHMCMHYGYWDETTPNLRAALKNMNAQLAQFADVQPGWHVLDAGCGVGGSSIFLAGKYNCRTTGITLSEKQAATATQNAAISGVADRSAFQQANYLQTDFPDNHFDLVWGMESVCYAHDKYDFLKEAFRILKPGGRVVIADFFHNDVRKGTADWQILDKWTKTWAIKEYAGVSGFEDDLKRAGFTALRKKDTTQNVLKSIKRLYYSFFPGLVVTYTGQALGMRTKVQTANTWSTYYQHKAYTKGLWKYMFYTGIKPDSQQ